MASTAAVIVTVDTPSVPTTLAIFASTGGSGEMDRFAKRIVWVGPPQSVVDWRLIRGGGGGRGGDARPCTQFSAKRAPRARAKAARHAHAGGDAARAAERSRPPKRRADASIVLVGG